MKKNISGLTTFILCLLFLFSTQNIIKANDSVFQNNAENDILGFSFLNKIVGLWNGPVFSDTPAGSFNRWYVDFRPISPSQVSQFSCMDANTTNYTSFFIVRHDEKLKIAMRTEGTFMNKGCVTYEVLDSVNEESGYYHFSDFLAGSNRAYTEFLFKEDSLTMKVFTNKFNKQETPTLHSEWQAILADRKQASKAKAHFNYPQPSEVKDFSNAFVNMKESIFFTFEKDPCPSSIQPYVGSVTINIKTDERLELSKHDELFLVLTTESLFEGIKYKHENLKYFSKYIYLPPDTKSYTLINVHPGKYYLFSFNDINGDKKHMKGDYMSSNITNVVKVPVEGTVTVETIIDFVMP